MLRVAKLKQRGEQIEDIHRLQIRTFPYIYIPTYSPKAVDHLDCLRLQVNDWTDLSIWCTDQWSSIDLNTQLTRLVKGHVCVLLVKQCLPQGLVHAQVGLCVTSLQQIHWLWSLGSASYRCHFTFCPTIAEPWISSLSLPLSRAYWTCICIPKLDFTLSFPWLTRFLHPGSAIIWAIIRHALFGSRQAKKESKVHQMREKETFERQRR